MHIMLAPVKNSFDRRPKLLQSLRDLARLALRHSSNGANPEDSRLLFPGVVLSLMIAAGGVVRVCIDWNRRIFQANYTWGLRYTWTKVCLYLPILSSTCAFVWAYCTLRVYEMISNTCSNIPCRHKVLGNAFRTFLITRVH